MAESNGSPVTWRELNLVVGPIQRDIGEIKSDVKRLLGGQATAAGVELATREDREDRRAWLPILFATLISLAVTVPVAVLVH